MRKSRHVTASAADLQECCLRFDPSQSCWLLRPSASRRVDGIRCVAFLKRFGVADQLQNIKSFVSAIRFVDNSPCTHSRLSPSLTMSLERCPDLGIRN
jgi:hypothetical protein